MWEMFEVMWKTILLLGLFHIAWFDYQTKMIKQKQLWILGAAGVIVTILRGELSAAQAVSGMVIGAAVLAAAWLSKEKIGFGDGWLFVVTGIFLGFLENLRLLYGSMMLAGIFSAICLLGKRKEKKERVAFAPFVLMAYVGCCL